MSPRPEGLDRNRGTMRSGEAVAESLEVSESWGRVSGVREGESALGRSDSEAFPSLECRRCVGGPLAPLTSHQCGTGTEVGAGRPSPKERGLTNSGH